MAAYANCTVAYIEAGTTTTLESQIAAYILTLDTTTHPVIGVFQYGAGVLVVAGA